MKHAYLIMAHEKINQLKELLKILDNSNNDIFLHIDIKLGIKNLCFNNLCKESNIFLIRSRNVVWGDYSQIQLELDLLKEAVKKKHYDYFHLLSGVDFPIKSQTYIQNFFLHNNGKEFVSFDINNTKTVDRFNYYYVLQKYVGRNKKGVLAYINNVLIGIQKKLHLKRIKKKNYPYYKKGANWFSITNNLACYILTKEDLIRKTFKYSLCCDEVFLQTIMYNSPFYENLYKGTDLPHAHMRLFDWRRGDPYTWSSKDIGELESSPFLFARKFDINKDPKILDTIKKINRQ